MLTKGIPSWIVWLSLASAILVGCTPSNEEIEATVQVKVGTGVAATVAAIPVPTDIPTPSPIPLSGLDFESVLVVPGDLPAAIQAGQIRDFAPTTGTARVYKFVEEMPHFDRVVYQELRGPDPQREGSVIILLSGVSGDVEAGYALIAKYLMQESPYAWEHDEPSRPVDGIGEEATLSDMKWNMDSAAIVFKRCHAVVYILMNSRDVNDVLGYARRLDRRLTSMVCR